MAPALRRDPIRTIEVVERRRARRGRGPEITAPARRRTRLHQGRHDAGRRTPSRDRVALLGAARERFLMDGFDLERLDPDDFRRGSRRGARREVEALREDAATRGRTLRRHAIARVLDQPGVTAVIVGRELRSRVRSSHCSRPTRITPMPDVLIVADTVRSPELRHEVPLAVPDPFLYAEVGASDRSSSARSSRGGSRSSGPGLEVLTLEDVGIDELLEAQARPVRARARALPRRLQAARARAPSRPARSR